MRLTVPKPEMLVVEFRFRDGSRKQIGTNSTDRERAVRVARRHIIPLRVELAGDAPDIRKVVVKTRAEWGRRLEV